MKQYLKWFAKLILLALVLLIADFAVGKLDDYVFHLDSNSNPDYITNLIKMDDDMIIIGSSTASHHYIPTRIQDSLGLTVYNAGLDGAFFIFQNCAINYLVQQNPPRYILWEIDEDCLSDNMPQSREYQKMQELYPYYNNNYIHNAIDGRDEWQKYRMLSKIYRDNSSMVNDVKIGILSLTHRLSRASTVFQDSIKGYKPLPSTGYDYPELETLKVDEYVNPMKIEILKNTIHSCKKSGVKIIFTSSPRHYNADLLSLQQARKLKQIASEEEIPYLIFYNYFPLAGKSSFFKDNDHLNSNGTEAYMDVFIPALKRELLCY